MEGLTIPLVTPDTETDPFDMEPVPTINPSLARRIETTPPLMIRFRDGNGRLWVRWPDGKLTRERPSWTVLGKPPPWRKGLRSRPWNRLFRKRSEKPPS